MNRFFETMERQCGDIKIESNHLQYNIQLTGTWNESNTILIYDETTKTNIAPLINKLTELTNGENYDYLLNVKVSLTATGQVLSNQKCAFTPQSTNAYANVQIITVFNANSSTFMLITIAEDRLIMSMDFHNVIDNATITFDINY